MVKTYRQRITKIEKLERTTQYVYDISIKNKEPIFFANDIAVHNTDSAYFSAWPVLKEAVEAGEQEWNKDLAIKLYDQIADEVNISFPKYMATAHHAPHEKGEIIKCGREINAESALFITKKRYAVLVYDNEGDRLDTDGKPGKVKAMGLDLKRSDTPPIVQDFLSDILYDTLTGSSKEHVIDHAKDFKHKFHNMQSWEKGTPKRVNNLTKYGNLEKEQGKANMPGHVRAALNWNNMRRMNNDNHSAPIVDGMKTIVCKLKPNQLGWTSIGYPTDEAHLPEWFKELPFDDQLMEDTIIDKKLDNLLGVLDWGIVANTDINSTFENLFEI
jgi:hypothetical protein